jgi:uncharacterized protein
MNIRATLKLIDEFLWRLRRAGVRISTAEAIDAVRALTFVPWTERAVRTTLSATVAKSQREQRILKREFALFFSARAPDLNGQLRLVGLSEDQIKQVQDAIIGLAATNVRDVWHTLTEGSAHFDFLLQGYVGSAVSPSMLGFASAKAWRAIRGEALLEKQTQLRRLLSESLRMDLVDRVLDAVSDSLREREQEVRNALSARTNLGIEPSDEQSVEGAVEGHRIDSRRIIQLSPEEHLRMRRRIVAFAKRLSAKARKRRRGKRTLDLRKTLALARRTSGMPVQFARVSPRKDRSELLILCDFSESVRQVSELVLLFAHAARTELSKAKVFLFTSELVDATSLLDDRLEDLPRALMGFAPGVLARNSNYGRVFQQLLDRKRELITRKTTLVVLGDGRNNYQDAGLQAFSQAVSAARRCVWLATDPASSWGQGDSCLLKYASLGIRVHEAYDVQSMESALREAVRNA